MQSEIIQTQMLFIENSRIEQTYHADLLNVRVSVWEVSGKGHKGSFGGDRNVLYFDQFWLFRHYVFVETDVCTSNGGILLSVHFAAINLS